MTELVRFLSASFLALGCSSTELGSPCAARDGGPLASGSSPPDAGQAGERSAGGGVGSGGATGTGGAGASSTATGGAARGGATGTGGSRDPSSNGGESGAAAGGVTSNTGGGDTGGSSGSSGGAGTGGAVPGDAGVAVPSHCTDHRHDGDETDVDCGGSCSGCGPGSLCRTDADCGGVTAGCGDQCYCDTATSTCAYNDCYDNKTDALETDFDCGGPLCRPCDLGSKCLADTDCLSAACDVVTHSCIAEQCADGLTDGEESDVDCGGLICLNCAVGKKCHNTGDCQSGHVCLGVNKVCN